MLKAEKKDKPHLTLKSKLRGVCFSTVGKWMRYIPNSLHDANDDDGGDCKEEGEEGVGWGLLFW